MLHRGIIFLMIMTFVGCGQQPNSVEKRSKSESRGFSIIQIRDLVILPENPRSATPLQVSMQFRGEEPERIEYQWLRNGEPIPGAIWPTLKAEYVRRGDFIAVTVRAKQPGGNGDEQTSDPVIIGNTQPVATFSGVEPGTPTSVEKLKALGVGYDHDRDTVTFVYQWMVNGEPVVGQEERFLATSHFRRGDRVQVAVTPYDGEEFGMPLRSSPVVVGNSPPMIVSSPPRRTEEGVFHYPVQVEDPDGDTLMFSLRGEAPTGLEIDPTTGVVQWKVVIPDKDVTYVFQVVAEDPEGGQSIQEITLNYSPEAQSSGG